MTSPVIDAVGTAQGRPGLYASARGLVGTAVALVSNRIELFGVELAEEKTRFLSLLVYGLVAVLCLGTGLIFLAVFFTVLLWDSNRLLATGVFSALFLGAGISTALVARRFASDKSTLFSASLAELRKDKSGLNPD